MVQQEQPFLSTRHSSRKSCKFFHLRPSRVIRGVRVLCVVVDLLDAALHQNISPVPLQLSAETAWHLGRVQLPWGSPSFLRTCEFLRTPTQRGTPWSSRRFRIVAHVGMALSAKRRHSGSPPDDQNCSLEQGYGTSLTIFTGKPFRDVCILRE